MNLTPSDQEMTEYLRLRAQLSGLPQRPWTPPRHHHVVVKGLRLHVLEWGPAHAPPMLLLHGGGQNAHTWDTVCHAMADSRRLLAMDQRGHGDSEWSYAFDYGEDAHVEDICGVMDALGVVAPIPVVGMSMGCVNGARLALDHPGRVSHLVAVDAGPWVCLEGAEPIKAFVSNNAPLESLDAGIEAALRFNPRRDRRLLRVSLQHALRRLPDGRLAWKGDRRAGAFERDFAASFARLAAAVDRLRCPLLVVRGQHSRVLLDHQAQRFASAVPDGRWVCVANAGHTVQGDNPAGLVAALEAFLPPP